MGFSLQNNPKYLDPFYKTDLEKTLSYNQITMVSYDLGC